MILEIELGVLIALHAVAFAVLLRRQAPAIQSPPPPAVVGETEPHAEIVKREGDAWLHVGYRRAGHLDIAEAIRTPGLAVRHADGTFEKGLQ